MTGYEALSFMDGFSGYNQIKIHLDDAEMIAFRSERVCYQDIPINLKNARAIYQHGMTVIFKEML